MVLQWSEEMMTADHVWPRHLGAHARLFDGLLEYSLRYAIHRRVLHPV